MMLVCDFHVHLQSCFPSDRLLDAAYERCRSLVKSDQGLHEVVLVIVDRSDLRMYADICSSRFLFPGWQVASIANQGSVCLIKGDAKLHLVQGWQGHTLERLEYIAIGTAELPDEGRSLPETVAAIQQAGGIPVIPWGAGKWLGRRGRLLRSYLLSCSGLLCLGDNGGRPYGWGESVHFKIARSRGMSILPGSDPLPLPWEQHRIGSYCGVLEGGADSTDIVTNFKAAIAESRPVRVVGSRISPYTFFRLQFDLRRAKLLSRH